MQTLAFQKTPALKLPSFRVSQTKPVFLCRSWLNIAAPVVGVASAVPLSIAVDAIVDRVAKRVEQRSNVDANGVRCFLAAPDVTDSTLPVILVLHQLYGLQDREIAFCRDLAKRGFIAVAVDTLDRRASKWFPRVVAFAFEKVFLPTEPDYGVPAVLKVLEWIKAREWYSKETRIGVVGFCYGGGGSLRAAAAAPESFASVGVFYGRPLQADALQRLRCPIFAAYGTNDAQFPSATLDAFEEALRSLAGSTLLRFDGEGHAFVEDLDATRRPGAARDAWSAYLDFVERTLNAKKQ